MKKSFILAIVSFTSFFLLSSFASAQQGLANSALGAEQGINTFACLINVFTSQIISALGIFFLSAGVVAFFYGVVQYIWGLRQGDPTKAKVGNQFMIWGLVGLFVMFSVYGIIKIAQSLIPGLSDTTITIPEVNFKKSGSSTGGGTAPSNPGSYSCNPGAPCVQGVTTGTCNIAGTACLPTYSTPNPGTPGGTGTGTGRGAVGDDCKFTGNAGCESGYCDQATETCQYNYVN